MVGRHWFLLTLVVSFAARASECLSAPLDPTEAQSAAQATVRTTPIEFTRDVLPALTKAGARSHACMRHCREVRK